MRLGSSIRLDQLRPALADSAPARACVEALHEPGPAPLPDEVLYRWAGRYRLMLGSQGADWLMASAYDGVFLVNAQRHSLRCFVARPDEPVWLDVLARRVLPRVAMLYGATTVHAAAAAMGGGALMLLGQSGAGKSTLSAWLGRKGWDILSDDIAILWDPAAPVVAPSTTGACLWADSLDSLGLSDATCIPMPGYEGKVRLIPGGERATDPVPLRALVLLERARDADAPRLERVSGAEALIHTARQRIRFNPADATGLETADSFDRLSEIVRNTPCYRLHYPSRYDTLPQTCDTLRSLLQG